MSSSDFKERAKSVLKATYWMSFLACFIYVIITGVVSSITSRISSLGQDSSGMMRALENQDWEAYLEEYSEMQNQVTPFTFIGYAFSILATIFVTNLLLIGYHRVFVNARKTGKVDIGDLFAQFKLYGPTVKTMFFYDLYIYLWTLLFIIPGIIKGLSYFMVPYILTENPNIDTKRAFEISKTTMNGEKGNLFVLGLSFIGWYLLGVLACCIGVCFVQPYYEAARTEFYAYVKQKALATGLATPADFGEA
jgi:uncharacterized membrane protein